MAVGLSRPVGSFVSAGRTSRNAGELTAKEKPEVFDESLCSSAFASASFQSVLVSLSRLSFQELVAAGNATAIERFFSTLKKSLFNHGSGFASAVLKGSEMTSTVLAPTPTL